MNTANNKFLLPYLLRPEFLYECTKTTTVFSGMANDNNQLNIKVVTKTYSPRILCSVLCNAYTSVNINSLSFRVIHQTRPYYLDMLPLPFVNYPTHYIYMKGIIVGKLIYKSFYYFNPKITVNTVSYFINDRGYLVNQDDKSKIAVIGGLDDLYHIIESNDVNCISTNLIAFIGFVAWINYYKYFKLKNSST
jgi:hypothetical protein